jgi:hypothetical protein
MALQIDCVSNINGNNLTEDNNYHVVGWRDADEIHD